MDEIWDIIPHKVRESGFLLVFVMPEEEPDCGPQKLVGTTAEVELWEKRLQQAVWKVPNEQLWTAN
jgi:hypothetical protein